ncbi:hypothetical protein [Streptomyces uncialis]|uniref:Uncharacterized protein n=1 Tax=Streptomyces uncialis TaxID=1048205 RepID=A0A1Q4V1N9_9ACTN|nr:hypothetical protein [Streptomyces uncialis]OKH91726.1 hypothetical protein AB852_28530 [Streptomyces uncialis]
MTARRLRVLISRLPPESATMTAIRNATPDAELADQADRGEPEKGRWSQVEQLLAVVADRVARVEHVLVCANTGSKGRRPKPPEPIRRPGAKAPKTAAAMSTGQAAFLFQMINGGAV